MTAVLTVPEGDRMLLQQVTPMGWLVTIIRGKAPVVILEDGDTATFYEGAEGWCLTCEAPAYRCTSCKEVLCVVSDFDHVTEGDPTEATCDRCHEADLWSDDDEDLL